MNSVLSPETIDAARRGYRRPRRVACDSWVRLWATGCKAWDGFVAAGTPYLTERRREPCER